MRWISQLLMLILLFTGLYVWLSPALKTLWLQSKLSEQDPQQARASSFFPLEKDRWIIYDIAKQSRMFRFYFHAGILPSETNNTLKYQINYQWLDDNDNILFENIYHINTRPSPFLPIPTLPSLNAKHDGVPLATRFYNHDRSAPSLDQALYLTPSDQPQARTLRFRVLAKDAGIDEIGVRSYIQFHRDPQDIEVAWQRMSLVQREAISNGSVYPSFLLSDYERRNLLSAYWKPVGPIGVLDEDYRIETLYLRENTAPTLPLQSIVADGLFASDHHWLTFKLPSSFARYRLQWHSIHQQTSSTPSSMQLRWQNVLLTTDNLWQAPVTENQWQGELAEGLLQVMPNSSAILKLYQWQDQQWRDITPEKLRSRAYICNNQASLYFALAPGQKIQSLKVSAKGYTRSDQINASQPGSVIIKTLTKNGSDLVTDTLFLPQTPNPYQHFNDASLINSQVFETVHRYIDTPNNSHSLRIQCNTPTLISVSTRPLTHPIRRQLPRDRNYWHAYPDREPAWFTLQPKNAQQLITNQQYHSLLWYLSPIENSAILSSGQFSWQALNNLDTNALEKQLFSNHPSEQSTRMEARSVSYTPIMKGKKVQLAGKSQQRLLRPSAVYLRNKSTPQAIQVWLDNKPILNTTIAGTSGKIRLPNIKAGSHNIEIRSKGPAINWYINNTQQSQRSHLLRSAYPLKSVTHSKSTGASDKKNYSITLDLPINGNGQQLAIWLFAPQNKLNLNCDVSLQATRLGGSQPTHSFRHYHYSIASHSYALSQVLQQKDSAVHGPIPLTIQLNTDLPEQSARAQLNCDQPGVLASAGIISAGLSSSYDVKERLDVQ